MKGINLSNVPNVTILAQEAQICVKDTYFINAVSCENFKFSGGKIDGQNSATYGIQLQNSKNAEFQNVEFKNFGSVSAQDTAFLKILGDCTGFSIKNCIFDNITAGQTTNDGFIHAYGLLVSRVASTQAYSKTGLIESCIFSNIAGTDNGTLKADGDGIFIQAPPTLNNSVVDWKEDIRISINNCYFTTCKKRGIKVASPGVAIRNCVLNGDFYYAGIDAQYGHILIENCYVNNTSNYTQSITSAVVANDGGITIKNCTLKAPYGINSYHPGIRFNKRLPASIIPDSEPWDNIYIQQCFFDKVNYAVCGIVTDSSEPVPCNGIYIRDCRVGENTAKNPFCIDSTLFTSVKAFALTDWSFDYGTNRAAVRSKSAQFSYPLNVTILPLCEISCEIHSGQWTDEPVPANSVSQPNCPYYRIVFAGEGMGNITYKEWKKTGSIIYGTRAPGEISSILSKQLLYYSKIGDLFVDISYGSLYICVAAGSSDTIGTWNKVY